jgi:hypothetical protein
MTTLEAARRDLRIASCTAAGAGGDVAERRDIMPPLRWD